MKLSKTDFAGYLDCEKTFWLRRRRPELVAWAAPGAMQRLQMVEGQAVEQASRPFLEAHFGPGLLSQTTYETDTLIARADFIRSHQDGSIDILEVKASTKVKSKGGADHIADAAFQWLVASRAGHQVVSAHIIHLDGDYVREGDVDPNRLFVSADVTEQVKTRLQTLEAEIDAASELLRSEDIDLDGCDCQYKGVNQRCEAFAFLNPTVAAESAHYLPGIRRKSLEKWAPAFDLRAISASDLGERHQRIQKSLLAGSPVVDTAALRAFVNELTFPIHFYDYETTGPAVPPAQGYRPYQAIPVQFSVHRLSDDGTVEHSEWLAEGHGEQLGLIDHLERAIGADGSAVAWHKSFEIGCNARLATLHPEKAEFLERLSARTADLEVPFQQDYVDWRFQGSSSIKKVLPVLVPELRYPEEEVHDGTSAVEAWARMIGLEQGSERADLRRQLLEYCKLDTLAMLRIFEAVRDLVQHGDHVR